MQQKKFGVIGHPIGHSLSKVMHTRVFKELNLPHTYEAFDIIPENLEQFIKETDLSGINVTIPHKVEVMKYIDEISDEAKNIKAVNTISFNQQPTTNNQQQNFKRNSVGDNTDRVGFQESLKEEGISLENKNVLVIGAGGVSRAILVSLVNNNANTTLTNRTKQKAIDLIAELNFQDKIKIADYNPESLKQILESTDIIVNTTSLGMHSTNTSSTPHPLPPTSSEAESFSPIPKELLKPNHIIFDVIYNPLKTKLILDAESIGCKTISGVNMLVHQGAQSLRIWLGIEPPIQAMKDEVLKNLLH